MTQGAADCNYIMYTYSYSGNYMPTDTCIGYSYSSYNSSYMYACSDDMMYVTYTTYSDSYNCMGNASTTTVIWSNNTYYQFLCSAMDCIVQYTDTYYLSTADCTGTPYTTTQTGLVAGVCYNSSSTSLVYGCTDDDYTIFYYTDGMCATFSLSATIDEGCNEFTSVSDYYEIATCSRPGYYGIASSQIPSFSAFVSFVMVAIAFFVC